MKQLIFSSWHLMRLLRLIVGVSFVVTGFVQHDAIPVAFGSFFSLQALFNVGCCGVNGCNTSNSSNSQLPKNNETLEQVTFEEIKA